MALNNVFMEIRQKILEMLKEKLPAELTYHSIEHTLDVLQATEWISKAENVTDEELSLLKTAALFHDVGYIYSRENHEQKSCTIARDILSSNGIDNSTIEKVCALILATIFPHNPKNKLGEIICDADLDYLGRDDYFVISQKAFNEFKHFGIVNNEADWKNMQMKFLESHRYYTTTSITLRKSKKEEHLMKIKNSI